MKTKLLFLVLFLTQVYYGQINWFLSNNGMPQSYKPQDFAKAPNGDIYLICHRSQAAGDFAKLLKSTNNGALWTEVITSGLPNMTPFAIEFSGTKLLLAGRNFASQYVYSSTDMGLTWNTSNTGIPSDYDFSGANFAIASNGDVFLSAYKMNGNQGAPKLLKSTDSGANWSQVSMTGVNAVGTPLALSAIGPKLFMFCMNTSSSPFSEIYSSSDGGLNWTASSTGMPIRFDICDFAVKSNGEILAAGADMTSLSNPVLTMVSSTDNGTTWDPVSLNGITSMTYATSFMQTNGELLIAGYGASTFTYYVHSTAMPVNVQELSKDNNLLIYPNPAINSLRIKNISSDIGNINSIDIISAAGQIIGSCKNACDELDIKDLEPGVYYLKIDGSQKDIFSRFIKSN